MSKSFTISDPLPGTIFNNELVSLNKTLMSLAKRGGMCPCSVVWDKDHECPCLDYRTTLVCKCGLYIKE